MGVKRVLRRKATRADFVLTPLLHFDYSPICVQALPPKNKIIPGYCAPGEGLSSANQKRLLFFVNFFTG